MWPDKTNCPSSRSTREFMTSKKGVKKDRQKIPEYKQLSAIAFGVLAITSSMAQADPAVDGDMISWPDDGWYQVQSSDGATTLCNGGSSCTVAPGSYLVINHTSGIRYTDVQVSDAAGSDDVDGIVVSQKTISWPDDGWYQVQSMDGATTYCNGGRSCEVDEGVYRVINHTTGQRFDNIAVGAEPETSEISVAGQRISWPDDGWYQVQTADGIESLCNGGTYCDVPPGNYLVINHTTGERFTDIVVADDSPGVDIDTPSSGTINRDNHVEIVSQAFSVYTGTIFGNTLPYFPLDFVLTYDPTALEVSEEVQSEYEFVAHNLYACPNGGTLEVFYTQGDSENRSRTLNTWTNCLENLRVHNGTVEDQYDPSTDRGLYSADYSVVLPAGETAGISGRFGDTLQGYSDQDTRRTVGWTNSEVDYTFQSEAAAVQVSDASTNTRYLWLEQENNAFTAVLDGSYQLSSSLTDQQVIDVSTTEPLTVTRSLGESYNFDGYPVEYPAWTFNDGALELKADDGSGLRLRADSGDEQSAEVSLLQDGVVLETFLQPWSVWSDVLSEVQRDTRDD